MNKRIAIVTLVLLIAALACGDSGTAQPETKATSPPSPTEAPSYTLEVVGIEDPTEANPSFYEAKEGQKLVAVEIVVGNVDGETITVNPLNATLVDDEGFTYGAELAARGADQIELMDIAPGEKIRGWIAFEIPENATPTSIKYSIKPLGEPVLQADIE